MNRPIERLRVSSYSKASTPLEQSFYGRFVAELVRLRKARGWTQEALEHELGVAAGLVAKWETFQSLPGAFMLMCWCMQLDCRLTTLAIEVEENERWPVPGPEVETQGLRDAGLSGPAPKLD